MRTGCSKETMVGACKNLMWGALHRTMGGGVLRGTLDRGPLKHRVGSCLWDNVKGPIRSFRAPFVLRVYDYWSLHVETNSDEYTLSTQRIQKNNMAYAILKYPQLE